MLLRKNPNYKKNLITALTETMKKGRPDVLVLNGGIWWEGKTAGYPLDNPKDKDVEEFMLVRGGSIFADDCIPVLSNAIRE